MKIYLPQLHKTVTGNEKDSLFQILRSHDIPVASSCLGDGVCGKCRLSIQEGTEFLSPVQPLEQKLIEKYQLSEKQRISCQCSISGDVIVTSTYW
ncbi:2Fe-2S iron-sulfur cluster binding domain-containing protein [bacterium]|nr:2Fe-2S iron-sulfur cluster binding domain-containing protein [bacterium]